MRRFLFIFILLGWTGLLAQCPNCGSGTVDVGETSANCPQDVPHGATCTSPCSQPGGYDPATGIRVTYDFLGSTTWSTVGLPAGWTFAGAPSATTAGALPAADAYGAKAGLIQPNCSGSCTFTNGFCIGNLASTQAVGGGGASGKLGANFDGRPNVSSNLSYAVLRGQNSPTLVSETFNFSGVQGFKIQFWAFPSETSCGQLNSWGSCVGNAAFVDFSSNGGTSWTQIIQMDISSSNSDMCFNNSTNTKWLTESAWSRVCLTVYRTSTSPGNFYTSASSTTGASGILVNSAWFTSNFKFRIRYSQTASCTSGITTTNPGRYLALDYPVITSGNEMIPCGISFINMCGYGADANDDGVGSSTLTSFATAFGTVRRGVNQAERGVEILTSQSPTFASQNLSGSTFATNYDLCNAEGGDRQCIDWRSNNNFYTVVYECLADWEATSGTGINVQFYKGSTPQSIGMTKVTNVGKTALLGWRYSANRFVSCGSLSDLNPGCNGYHFLSGSLPTQFARGFYALSHNSTGQSWAYYGASSCNHYFNGPFFAPVAVPDTVTGSPNYTICTSGQLFFTGLSRFCSDASGLSGAGDITVSGPNGFNEVIPSGGIGNTPIVDAGTYQVTANTPTSPAQCVDCSRLVCITVSPAEIGNCGLAAYPGLTFWAEVVGEHSVRVRWTMIRDEDAEGYVVERMWPGGAWTALHQTSHVQGQQDYGYVEPSAWVGKRWYRLKLLKPDGDIAYSDAVEVVLADEQWVQVAPNPAKDLLHVQASLQTAHMAIELCDITGRVVRKWSLGSASADLGLEGIDTGVYLARISAEGRVATIRIGIQ